MFEWIIQIYRQGLIQHQKYLWKMPLFRFQFAFPSSPCILQTNNISISLKTNGQYFIFDYKASQDIELIVVHKPRWSQTEVLCSPSEMLLNIFRRYFLLQIGNVDLYFQMLYWCCKKEMLLYPFWNIYW